MPEAPLVIENLSFQYRTRPEPAIENISFELQAGELLLIAGSSGCGKTTLARCINGLIPRSYRGSEFGKGKLVDSRWHWMHTSSRLSRLSRAGFTIAALLALAVALAGCTPVAICMSGGFDSLNVGTAGAIALHHFARRA